MKTPVTYKEAGVNIDTGNAFVEAIKPLIQKTKRPEVLSGGGGFSGLFSINKLKYDEPVLVSSTDGVGTKLKLAKDLGIFKGIGVDLVAMCVNDLLCVGAEPLFFLDYYACGRLEPGKAIQVVEGIAEALVDINCALIGGETAEMPGIYQADEFDLAGFSVGVVNRGDMIDGSGISIGNKIIGLESSGVHSNGFSLVRKIIEDCDLDLRKTYPGFKEPLGEILLTPTLVYVNPVHKVKKQFSILGLAHITGGGLLENLPRILPAQTRAILNPSTWTSPAIFDFLQEKGAVAQEEMYRVFNCGIGMALVVHGKQAEEMVDRFNGTGYAASIIGEVVAKTDPQDPQVQIKA